MERAAVLIGVKKSDDLPELQAAWDGVQQMAEWAHSQGIKGEDLVIITDKQAEPVSIQRIKKAVRALVDRGTIEQLIVYFSGHGINNARAEYWLLSGAIVDPDEAVNVTGSEDLARYCGIPHVVFFSDACRTAAVGIQAQGVTGGVVFPNLSQQGAERQVDLFFAATLGHPALEIPDVNDSARDYSAVYTDTLVEALSGQHGEIAEPDATQGADVVRAWPLKGFLAIQVPVRVYNATGKQQTPDARITSPPNAWISVLPSTTTTRGVDRPSLRAVEPSALQTLSARALRNATEEHPVSLEEILGPGADPVSDLGIFGAISRASARSFGPSHFETQCGFKVAGMRIVSALARTAICEILADGSLVRIELASNTSDSVLLVFENGTGVVLPAIHQFLGALTFVRGELVSVNYDPTENSGRWGLFESRQEQLRQLRAVVAASSATGSFQLKDDDQAARVARNMQLEKGVDPALSVYAAYAYRDRGQRSRIREMADYQQGDLGFMLFDVAMLSRRIDGQLPADLGSVLPFAPLLSQGWALLPAHGIEIPPSLRRARTHLDMNSLWTLYGPGGVAEVRAAMETGEVYRF